MIEIDHLDIIWPQMKPIIIFLSKSTLGVLVCWFLCGLGFKMINMELS
jgi:hypothetical protein